MQSILNLTKTNKLILATFAFLAVLTLGSGRAHAATLNVSGGCTLDEAITSVNAGANQSGCTATVSPDAYGTNDTITIPAGTVTLVADLPVITEPLTVAGAGMGSTIIDGDNGQYKSFVSTDVDVTISGMTITAYSGCAVEILRGNTVLHNLEVDGEDADPTCGIFYNNNSSVDRVIESRNLYIHNFNIVATSFIHAFMIAQSNGGTTTIDIQNTTLSDFHVTGAGGGINGIAAHVGTFGSGGGNITGNITNVTVDDVTSDFLTAPFNNAAISSGAPAIIDTRITNITITGTRGITSTGGVTVGLRSAAFYAAGAVVNSGSGDSTDITVTVSNSLMADNLNDGVPSNCATGDFTPGLGGTGVSTANIVSAGYNISDDAGCAGFNQTGDQQNVGNIISTLGPLQNNGGAVPTRALLEGSPAIAAGGAVLGVTTDARGIARPSTCPSVGAFQFEGAVCAASTTSGGSNAGAPNTGIKPSSSLVAIIATVAGLAGIGYAFRTRSRSYS